MDEVRTATALERQFREEGYILPIRLDATPVPDLPSTIGYIDITKSSPAEIANLVQQKFSHHRIDEPNRAQNVTPGSQPDSLPSQVAVADVPIPKNVPGFEHTYYDSIMDVRDRSLLDRCSKLHTDANVIGRARLAKDLVREVSFRYEVSCGPAYTSWRVGDTIYVSTLPGVYSYGQKTLEFDLRSPALALVGKWTCSTGQWAPIKYQEFHHHVRGLMADRSGCDMGREATLMILKARGASFEFPAAPAPGDPETLCGWRREEVRPTVFDWDRNPQLVGPDIGLWDEVFHRPTGQGLLMFVLQGGWSNAALYEFRDSLEVLLPSRYRLTLHGAGSMLVGVHLCNAPTHRSGGVPHYSLRLPSDELDFLYKCRNRTYAAIARAEAASRQLPIAPPTTSQALPELSSWIGFDFSEALKTLGHGVYPQVADALDHDVEEATWTKLRQETGLPESQRFAFSRVVSNDELLAYVASVEADQVPGDC